MGEIDNLKSGKSTEIVDDAPDSQADGGNARPSMAHEVALLMAEGRPTAWIGGKLLLDRDTVAGLAAEHELAWLADKHLTHWTDDCRRAFLTAARLRGFTMPQISVQTQMSIPTITGRWGKFPKGCMREADPFGALLACRLRLQGLSWEDVGKKIYYVDSAKYANELTRLDLKRMRMEHLIRATGRRYLTNMEREKLTERLGLHWADKRHFWRKMVGK